MIFPGTQIQRGGHGKCGLLPKRLLSNHRAELLSSSGVLASAGAAPNNFRPHTITSVQELRHVADHEHRNPPHLRGARHGERVPAPTRLTSNEWLDVIPSEKQRVRAKEAYRMAV